MTTLRPRWRLCGALILQSVFSVALQSLADEKPRGAGGAQLGGRTRRDLDPGLDRGAKRQG